MRRSDRYNEEISDNKLSRVNKNEYLLKELEVGIGTEDETFSRTEKNEEIDSTIISSNINLESYNLKNYIRKAKESIKNENESLVTNQFSYLEELNKKYYENYEKEKEKELEEKDLFSDLMIDEKEENNTVAHDVEDSNKDKVTEEDGKLINSFYTRSMDLSKGDFISLAKEDQEEITKKNNFIILFVILLIIILIIGVLYYTGVFKNIGIKL